MQSDQFNFVWNLISLFWLKNQPDSAKQLSKNIYNENIYFTSDIELLVVQYSINGDEESIRQLALLAAKNFSYLTDEKIQLVALLVSKKLIGASSAAELLINSNKSEKYLNKESQSIVDIVWLLDQDEKDNVMRVDQDNLLIDAFEKLLNGFS